MFLLVLSDGFFKGVSFLCSFCLYSALFHWRWVTGRSSLTGCDPRGKDIPAMADNTLIAAVFILPIRTGNGSIGTTRADTVRMHIGIARFPQRHSLINSLLLLLLLLRMRLLLLLLRMLLLLLLLL